MIIPRNHGIHFISAINIGDQIRDAIRKAGFVDTVDGKTVTIWRPYNLRHYFATQTLEAESKGTGLIRDFRVFFMGHKGDIEHQYTLNNRALSKDKIEDMRESYSKALKYLETENRGIKEEDYTKDLKDTSITILENGFKIKLSDAEKEELYALEMKEFQERLSQIFSDKKADIVNNGNKQKVIRVHEIETYIGQGCEYVNSLPGNKAIVKLP